MDSLGTCSSLTNHRETPLKSNFQFIRKVFFSPFLRRRRSFFKNNINRDRVVIHRAFTKDNDNDYVFVLFYVHCIVFINFSSLKFREVNLFMEKLQKHFV